MPSTTDLTTVRPLGEGGFGTTALVERDGKRYVLKRLKLSAIEQHGQAAIDLFLQESDYLRQLGNHPQIPALIDAGMDETPWLLQEYIPGSNLEQILSQQSYFSEHEIITLLKSLLPVLHTIHQCGAIHRDVKPANIIFANEQYHLVDFGASKRVSETVMAKTGTMIGSAIYAAPEQVIGRATFASDIYSLGVTCIHLLTGLPPMELMDRMNAGQWCWRDFLPKERTVSEGLSRILDKMLEYGVHRRYAKADEVLEALGRIDRYVVQAKRVAWVRKAKKIRFASRLVTRTVSFLAVAATGVAIVWGIAQIAGDIWHLLASLMPHLSPDEPSALSVTGKQMTDMVTFPFYVLGGLTFLLTVVFGLFNMRQSLFNGEDITYSILPTLFALTVSFVFFSLPSLIPLMLAS